MKQLVFLGLILFAGCGPSQQWEYEAKWVVNNRDLPYRGEGGIDQLNNPGKEGWELAAVQGDPRDSDRSLLIFKRRK